MSFWWVSQNKTHYNERNGGYLWAPKRDKSGKRQYHWDTMTEVRKGDIIFSYFRQHIVAYATAEGVAYDFNNPFNEAGEDWEVEGRKIDASYTILDRPIYIPDIVNNLQKILKKQAKYKPININGTGNQGYLFPLIDEAGNYLLSLCK